MTGRQWLASTATMAMVLLSLDATVHAQTTSSDSGISSNQNALAEIVVTAQRRKERLQDVPATVTSLGGAELEKMGINNSEDLTLAVPGLIWGRSTAYSQPTIRGIGTRSGGGDEVNVAMFIDGVYQPDQFATVVELANIERIEVLKGPQGTLFGRNATGGAINIITPKPSFDLTGSASLTYGDFEYRKAAAYISGPIVQDKVAASLSVVAYGDDGYIKNLYLNETQGSSKGWAVRPKVLIRPSDRVTAEINGLFTRSNDNALLSPYAVNGDSAAGAQVNNPILNTARLPLSTIVPTQPYTTATAFVPTDISTITMGDMHVTYDFDWASATLLAAHGRNKLDSRTQTDASPLALSSPYLRQDRDYTVANLSLTSPSGKRLTWIGGVESFFSDYDAPVVSNTRRTSTGTFLVTDVFQGEKAKSYAVFGEATYEIAPRLFLTAGLRYSWENKRSYREINTGPVVHGDGTWGKVTPRAVIRYAFTDDVNVYASYSEGFKSGILDQTRAVPLKPEIVKAYEIGAKMTIANRIRAEIAGFHYDYKDLQVSTILQIQGVPTNLGQNAGTVAINGLEASASVAVISNITLDGTVTLLHTKIDDFPNASVTIPGPSGFGNITGSRDLDGFELLRAPKVTYSVGPTYQTPLFDGTFTLTGRVFHSGAYWVDLGNFVRQPAFSVVNASATWKSNHGYYVTVFGQNLSDEVYPIGYLVTGPITSSQAQKPRWFGVTVGCAF